MNEDPLRDRIRAIDPAPPQVAVEPPTTPSSRARLEQIMNTTTSTNRPTQQRPARTSIRWVGAAAVVAAIVGVGAVVALSGDRGNDANLAQSPLQLTLGADDTLASCLPLEAATLATMSPAFAATATTVEGETVTLDVDHWYAGGDAATVELHAQPGMEALIAGFDFEVGQEYLITATDGTVNFCGYSGPATAELTAVFDQAFPSS